MSHDHNHHSHGPPNYTRAFALGVALNLSFVAVEFGFGLWSQSVALMADAGHNLSDVLGLLLAWAAAYASTVGPNERRTYGLRRTSILAALVNALVLLLVTGGITWEAVRRLTSPAPVMGTTMMAVAAVGVVVNGATALLFFSGCRHDLNLRSAFLVTREFAPAMAKRRRGDIFFMASIASLRGFPRGGAYVAAKHGLLGLARSFRAELKSRGVRVMTILPGATWSPSWEGSGVPPERMMPTEDIARAFYDAYRMSRRTVVEEWILRPQLGDVE
jgi:NAD(P)-dependent dehydrogenase (short-subunit alcohol dehydrogenase family)